uniref:Major sperm protein n=1 Tax=Panagrellus redivivus TaxID=6233 RepID=A0A7E4UZ31_PANRE
MADNNNKSKSGQLGTPSSTQKAPESEKWDLSEKKKTPVPTTVTAGTATTTVPMESRENVSDRGGERTDAYVTSIESVQVRIEPDVIRIDSSAELTTLHNVYNMGDTPVVFRVKVTSPSVFRVRPVTGQVPPKGNTALKVTRLANAPPRSDRFDVEFMPLVPEIVPREKWAPVLPNGVVDFNVIKPASYLNLLVH